MQFFFSTRNLSKIEQKEENGVTQYKNPPAYHAIENLIKIV